MASADAVTRDRRDDADDASDRDRRDHPRRPDRTGFLQDQGGDHKRGDCHAGYRVVRAADESDHARGHRREKETEECDQDRAKNRHGHGRHKPDEDDHADKASDDGLHREIPSAVAYRAAFSVRRAPGGLERMEECRQRPDERDETAYGDGPCANIAHVVAPDVLHAPGVPQGGGLRNRRDENGHQHHPPEHRAAEQECGNLRPYDVSDAQERGRNVKPHRAADELDRPEKRFGNPLEPSRHELDGRRHAKSGEHVLRVFRAGLARAQHVRAGKSLRIGQRLVRDDQRTPQRHHQQDAERSARKGDQRDGQKLGHGELRRALPRPQVQRRQGEDRAPPGPRPTPSAPREARDRRSRLRTRQPAVRPARWP